MCVNKNDAVEAFHVIQEPFNIFEKCILSVKIAKLAFKCCLYMLLSNLDMLNKPQTPKKGSLCHF